MRPNLPKNAVEKKIRRSLLLLSTILILLSLGVTLYYDVARQRREIDASITGAAAYIASLPSVVAMLRDGYPDPLVKQSIDALCDTIPNVNVVAVCDKNDLRFYHTDRQKTGDSYVNGEQTDILAGSEPYITEGYGSKGIQRCAFHAIRDPGGQIIGFVTVSVFAKHISAGRQSIVLVYLLILGVMLLVSFSLTNAIAASLRKALMGFQPEELLRRYLKQDEILGAVEEGIVATGPDGAVLFANTAAERLLGEQGPLVGRQLTSLLPDTKLRRILKTGQAQHSQSWIVAGHTVMANEIPLHTEADGQTHGVLTILFDKTEMLRMSDELFGARSMLDALRSFNHEFSNKLHVILGYLETGQTQQAVRFIVRSNLVPGQLICQTADQIRVSELCALIIGKMMHAAELGIQLTLAQDSCCFENDLLVPVSELGTIVGNLLENAIEALDDAGDAREIKEIKLGVYCRPDCNLIVCEDTGGGVPREIEERIFEKNVSSKGERRGTGLYLIAGIAARHAGKIAVETEPGEGSCFTITFTKAEAQGCIES